MRQHDLAAAELRPFRAERDLKLLLRPASARVVCASERLKISDGGFAERPSI